MRGSKQTKHSKELFLTALEASLGIVTLAAEKTTLSRTMHYTWLEQDEDYRARVEAIGDKFLDLSEAALAQLIREKNVQAVMFHLRTKGRKRGYVERQEVDSHVKITPTMPLADFISALNQKKGEHDGK